MSEVVNDQRFPIGKYQPQPYSQLQFQRWVNDIKHLPAFLETAVLNLDEEQYNTPYRDGGWTVKQLVHHIADSHLNAYMRFKLGVTEDTPQIKTYNEKLWAELDDVNIVAPNVSVTMLHALHLRWYTFLQQLTEEDLKRTIFHPEHKREISLWFMLGLYAWHGRHHVAHILAARELYNWK